MPSTVNIMPRTVKLLVVVHDTSESEDVRDALINRAAAGPVHVTLVGPAPSDAGAVGALRTVAAQRLERAAQELRDAGIAVEDVVWADPEEMVAVRQAWDAYHFDEIVVSCRPWLSCIRGGSEPGSAGP
jgi:hypothetical protein